MSSDEVLKDNDETTVEDVNDKDMDVLKDDENESSSDDDDEEEESESDDEETDDEDADEEIDTADVGEEGVSGEDETDEEEDEDSDEDEEDEQEEELENADLSSGDENCDRCPICLNRLGKQNIGTPESCDHSFCLECIQEWAKNVNTCPVDRQVFRIILAKHAGEEKIFKQFPVEDHQQENEEEEEEDPTYCEVCGQSDREDRLLLCDRCDLGYHCDCLDPPLANVPVHEWFCPDCQQSRNTVDSEPPSSGRQIARTRVSERVRRLIAEARAERAERRRRIAAIIEAEEAVEGEEPTPGPSASGTTTATKKRTITPRKRKTTRRKTTRRKTKKRKTKKKTAGKKTKTRRKRKSKGKGKKKRKTKKSASSPSLARTAIFRSVTSVKGRIADKLGLSKPPAGRSIPMQKLPQSGIRQEGIARSSIDHGTATFSILGSKDELYLFADQEGEERQPVNRPAIPVETLLSRSAKSSHKPLNFSLTKSSRQAVMKETSSVTAPAIGGFDLLGSILQNQDLLHKGSKHVTINRDGSLSAANNSISATRSTSSTKITAEGTSLAAPSQQLSSTVTSSRNYAQSSSYTSGSKSVETSSPSKLQSSNKVSFSISSISALETSELVQVGLSPQSDSTKEASQFSETTSSDVESKIANANDDLLLPGKKIYVDNSGDGLIWNKVKTELSETESTSSNMDSLYVEGTQTDSTMKSECKTDISTGVDLDYGLKHDTDYNKDTFYSIISHSAVLDNGTKPEFSSVETKLTEQESKPIPSSESSSNGIYHSLSTNNSPDIGSRDSVSIANVNVSPRPHTGDVNSVMDLEADAVFSNNARLNAEEDAANNSTGFNAAASSQVNLRNFAAVTSSLNNVYDDNNVGVMKRNFDLLVSTSSNLAGYESGEENDNIERNIHHPVDREEGEASDSNDDGDVREIEDSHRVEDEQEEGEIVEEEERDRWAVGRNGCSDDHEDSGGLDVNAIHIEEMEIGTFRKRSMSQNEDNNNEGSKKMKKDEITHDSETKQENESQEEDSGSEDDSKSGKIVNCSFMLSSLLTSLKTNEKEVVENKEEPEGEKEQKITKEEEKKQEEEKEDLTMKPISILDFIGDASAKKFGLQMEEIDAGRFDQSYGQPRGGSRYTGSNNFGYRGSRSSNNRGQNHMQKGRDGNVEDGCEEIGGAPMRPYDRRRNSWQEEERDRQRSGSRDGQVSSRSGSHEMRPIKLQHGRDAETGRSRRDEQSRERSGRSRSSSGSPRRRGEKRRKSKDQEEKSRHSRKGKKSRWNNEDEVQTENVEEDVRKPEEVNQKHDSGNLSAIQTNGYPPPAAVPDRHVLATGHYQSQQYPVGVAPYSYPRIPGPPLPCSHPPPLGPPHVQTHPLAPHPGLQYGHSAPPSQSPYSQIPPRPPPHPDAKQQHHHGFPTSYYPQPQPASVVPTAPPPPSHPYPHTVYAGHYQSQPGQTAATISHSNPHIAATGQHHPGYPRYPQAVVHPYPHSAPRPAYQPRPVAPGSAPLAVYGLTTSASSGYPPQQHLSATTTLAVPRYSYPTVATKQEPIPQATAIAKQESSTSTSNRPPPEPKRLKESMKESSPNNVKQVRASYRISPPSAPIKGVTTYDKVDSSILLNEVKKGFRQLVEDAVRNALKGAWSSKKVTKEEYKDIFKRAVEKVCGSKETVVHQEKIQSLVNAYVIKARKTRKVHPTSN